MMTTSGVIVISAITGGSGGPPRPRRRRNGHLSWGSCGYLGVFLMLTWRTGGVATPSGCTTLPVIPRCSLPDLVRLWCGGCPCQNVDHLDPGMQSQLFSAHSRMNVIT